VRTTYRQAVTFRVPLHLLTQLALRAEVEGTTVTALVERGIEQVLKRPPKLT
jgi:hypothetical protein